MLTAKRQGQVYLLKAIVDMLVSFRICNYNSWRYCVCISIAFLPPPPIPLFLRLLSFSLSPFAGLQSSIPSKRLLISFSNARIDPSYLSLPNTTPTDIDFVTSIAVIGCSAARESEVAAGFESCSQIQPTSQPSTLCTCSAVCPWTWLFLRHSPYLTPAALFLVLGPAALPDAYPTSTGISGTFEGKLAHDEK